MSGQLTIVSFVLLLGQRRHKAEAEGRVLLW